MIPIKGHPSTESQWPACHVSETKTGFTFTEIGTDTAKEQIYNRFTLTPEGDEPLPGAVHFPNNPDILI
ncbi:hypothetical protein [Escherichia coli]|uniref:hypothetical protein n=1 Tax=Escherichia coli TaxID=562 RepID=UPI0020260AD5|nr:hypothetical protein [Escherichia coli]